VGAGSDLVGSVMFSNRRAEKLDCREPEFLHALAHFQQRERRFGRTSEQQQERERAGAAR